MSPKPQPRAPAGPDTGARRRTDRAGGQRQSQRAQLVLLLERYASEDTERRALVVDD